MRLCDQWCDPQTGVHSPWCEAVPTRFDPPEPGHDGDLDPLAEAERVLMQAELPGGHYGYMIGRALVGIGWALVDWRRSEQQKGAPDGNAD